MKIHVACITPRQKLIIEKGLCDYRYIMHHWRENDSDFQTVYYQFYLKARWALMNNPKNAELYFRKLQSISPEESLLDIIDDLSGTIEKHSCEFSICSKLLHTRNDSVPIYDSKVRKYLSKEENVDFWWNCPAGKSKKTTGISEMEKIEHDWLLLNTWYTSFLSSKAGIEWIDWFNRSFPSHASISDIKKADFIIFATT